MAPNHFAAFITRNFLHLVQTYFKQSMFLKIFKSVKIVVENSVPNRLYNKIIHNNIYRAHTDIEIRSEQRVLLAFKRLSRGLYDKSLHILSGPLHIPDVHIITSDNHSGKSFRNYCTGKVPKNYAGRPAAALREVVGFKSSPEQSNISVL